MTNKSISILGLILVALALTFPVQASALRTPQNTCEEINCEARPLGGTVLSFPPFAYPWTAELFANKDQCFRFDVIEQAADLEMTVIAPSGQIFQNDDKGTNSCPACPLVKIGQTPLGGWYTVRVGRANGTAVNASFTMMVSQYPIGNPNCADPTPVMGH